MDEVHTHIDTIEREARMLMDCLSEAREHLAGKDPQSACNSLSMGGVSIMQMRAEWSEVMWAFRQDGMSPIIDLGAPTNLG